MIGILIFDSIARYLLLFYFLILSSNACSYLSLLHVMRHYEVPEGTGLRNRVKYYFYVMNVIYVLMILAAFIPGFAPACSNISTYPTILSLCNVLFLVNACFFWVMYKEDFFFSQSETEDEKCPII